ncbi:hypothetical protein [Hyphomicrobium sp.]|uniref:hypothetical protein n=1 Tax=Hyphomicrobium sp. TaxID=82 RepID=UPI003F6FC922
MALTKRMAPPNSVVLVSDVDGGEIPKTMGGSLVSATSTCVAVGCLSEDDGETEFTLAPLGEVDRADNPVYEGMLRTPKRHVVIRSVLGEHLLELPVLQEVTEIKIWANDLKEPDKVLVGVG